MSIVRPNPVQAAPTFLDLAELSPGECPWRPPSEAPATDPLVGRSIRGCRVRARLAEGGMGAVYLAHHEGLGRDVVVKVLKPGSERRPRRVERFLREARLAASVRHRNVVAVQDVGTTEDGIRFILMEFVAGRTLAQLMVDEGALSAAEATRLVLGVAEALVALHDAGIIHRDVKPENVVVTPSGRVKLIDFGLAKELSDDALLTAPGAVVGTPVYLAPEVGRCARLDGRADIYSLGLTFYALLTGSAPYSEQPLEELLLRRVPLPPPDRLVPDLTEATLRVLGAMLATSRDDRYPDARALVRDLSALLAGNPVHAPEGVGPWPPADRRRLAPRSRRRRRRQGRYLLITDLDPRGELRLHRAFDLRRDRIVSLRIFGQVSALPAGVASSLRRVRRVRHPRLIPPLRATVEGQRLCVAGPPVRGEPLADRAPRLRTREVAAVLRDVASALAAAHAEGFSHGALQPGSVLVDEAGRGLLLDLGLGSVVRQALRGLPSRAFQPPEGDGSLRADVYGLGGVFHHALCGRLPSPGCPPPSSYRPGIPAALDKICRRALSSDPRGRYPHAGAFADDLSAFLDAEDRRAWTRSVRKERMALVAAAGVLVLLALGLVSANERAQLYADQAARYEQLLLLHERR